MARYKQFQHPVAVDLSDSPLWRISNIQVRQVAERRRRLVVLKPRCQRQVAFQEKRQSGIQQLVSSPSRCVAKARDFTACMSVEVYQLNVHRSTLVGCAQAPSQ
jgi:hypothetical protein